MHKTTSTDDKRLQNTLKRLGVNTIPGIEEVNIFKDDTVIHFTNPKVQASIAANTYVVSGPSQTKKLQDLLPGIINQLGPDNLVRISMFPPCAAQRKISQSNLSITSSTGEPPPMASLLDRSMNITTNTSKRTDPNDS